MTEKVGFTLILGADQVSNIMGALSFSHGFLGATSPETQDQLIDIHNEILRQVEEQLRPDPDVAVDGDDE